MRIDFSPPDISEAEILEVVDTLKSGWITTGPKVKRLEENLCKYVGADNAVCLNSATAALELTLRILNIGEGDEVITSAYTYTATASAALHTGAKVVLVDTQKDSINMDLVNLESKITPKTKAIIPVDVGGFMQDYNSIIKLAKEKNNIFKPNGKIQEAIGRIAVIADGAHSLGAVRDGKKSGTAADFTAFSFHAVKNLTTAEGGAVTFNNINGIDSSEIYKQYQLYSLHGQSKDAYAKMNGCWEYDIVGPYYKCNMTDIMASLGIAQLKRYDSLLERRFEIIKMYDEGFKGTNIESLKHIDNNSKTSGHLYITRLNGFDENMRGKFINKLLEKGIRANVHFKPLCLFTAYKNLGFDEKDFKNAVDFYKNEVSIPLHTKLSDEQVSYVIESCKQTLKEF